MRFYFMGMFLFFAILLLLLRNLPKIVFFSGLYPELCMTVRCGEVEGSRGLARFHSFRFLRFPEIGSTQVFE